MPPAVKNILIINVVLFLAVMILKGSAIDSAVRENGFLGGITDFLGLHYPFSPKFKPFQLVTHFFMHAGFGHILFNMFALWMFGSKLENVWGSKRFLNFYFICALGSLLTYSAWNMYEVHKITGVFNPDLNIVRSLKDLSTIYQMPAVGASGAIYGLLGAFAVLFPNTELMLIFLPIPIKAKYFMPGLILLEFYLGISNYNWDPMAHFAHIGGLIFGVLMVLWWNKTNRNSFY